MFSKIDLHFCLHFHEQSDPLSKQSTGIFRDPRACYANRRKFSDAINRETFFAVVHNQNNQSRGKKGRAVLVFDRTEFN